MFRDRTDAGEKLAQKLEEYRSEPAVIFALPRGGVETALPIARALSAPLDLVIPRKIGHPLFSEFAIAAVDEDGEMLENASEAARVDSDWFAAEKAKEQKEAARRRDLYLRGIQSSPVEGKVAIIVDDGVATGLTMRLAILGIKRRKPRKIVVAVPVIPQDIAKAIAEEVDALVVLASPKEFLGAVGAYYESFAQIADEEVVAMMRNYHAAFTKQNKAAR